MTRRVIPHSKGIIGFIQAFVGLVLLVVLAIVLNALFTPRSFQTASQPQQPEPQSPSPTLTSSDSQADPTAGWNIYQDKKYGYSIKYPPEWVAEHSGEIDADTLDYVAFSDPSLPEANMAPVLAIHIMNRSYSEEVEAIRTAIGAVKEIDITIANIKGKKLIGGVSGPGPQFVAFVLPIDMGALLITATPEQEREEYFDVIQQVISTLGFVE